MRALIATDVVARGLDFANVSHVVNFAPPHQTADYINRIGRTARAGAAGAAINMIAPDEITMYAAIKELVGESCIEEKTVAGTSFNANAVANMRVDRRQKQYLQTPSLAGTGGAFHAKSEKRLKTNSGGLKQKLKYKRKK